MEPRICDQCGQEIEEGGIRHRRRLFCSDECCEEFEDAFMSNGEPDDLDLDDDDLDDLDPLEDADDLDGLDDDGMDSLDDDDF